MPLRSLMANLFANPHLDPLAEHYRGSLIGQRDIILTDMGIRQAIAEGLISISPQPDFTTQTDRIQPSTLDMKIAQVIGSNPLGEGFTYIEPNPNTLHSMRSSGVSFTEVVTCNDFIAKNDSSYLYPTANCRSSLHRLTAFMIGSAPVFNCFDTKSEEKPPKLMTITELQNYSWNDILVPQNQRFVQLFFHVDPIADMRSTPLTRFSQGLYRPKNQTKIHGDVVRELEMAVEVNDEETLHWLNESDYFGFSVANIPRLIVRDGLLAFHASRTAYRVNRLPHVLDFTKRKEYEESLVTKIDISKGYKVKPGELIIVKTQERVRLGSQIGMQVVQHIVSESRGGVPFAHLTDSSIAGSGVSQHLVSSYKPRKHGSLGGWIDPGYSGIMTCLVMHPGRVIKPGDEIGYCRVYFSPKPVGIPYGSTALGSQYQSAGTLQLAKK